MLGSFQFHSFSPCFNVNSTRCQQTSRHTHTYIASQKKVDTHNVLANSGAQENFIFLFLF